MAVLWRHQPEAYRLCKGQGRSPHAGPETRHLQVPRRLWQGAGVECGGVGGGGVRLSRLRQPRELVQVSRWRAGVGDGSSHRSPSAHRRRRSCHGCSCGTLGGVEATRMQCGAVNRAQTASDLDVSSPALYLLGCCVLVVLLPDGAFVICGVARCCHHDRSLSKDARLFPEMPSHRKSLRVRGSPPLVKWRRVPAYICHIPLLGLAASARRFVAGQGVNKKTRLRWIDSWEPEDNLTSDQLEKTGTHARCQAGAECGEGVSG